MEGDRPLIRHTLRYDGHPLHLTLGSLLGIDCIPCVCDVDFLLVHTRLFVLSGMCVS